MAQEMTGLFGPTEREIRSAIDEKGRADTQTLFAGAPRPLMLAASELANAGRDFGSMFESLGGYVDPRVEKARKMEMVKQQVLSSGISPADNPAEFARVSAQYLAKAGLADEAYGAAMYARQMEQETEKQAWEQEKFDKEWASRTQIARMQGEYGNEQARIMADARVSAAGSGDGTGWQYDENLAKKFAEDYTKLIDGTPELRKKYEKAWVPDALGGFDRKRLEIDAAAAGREAASMVASKRVSGGDAFNFVANKVFFAGTRGGGDGASPKTFDWNDPKSKNDWMVKFFNANSTATPAQAEAAFTNAKAQAASGKKPAPGPVDAVDKAATDAAIIGPKSDRESIWTGRFDDPTPYLRQELRGKHPRQLVGQLIETADKNARAWRNYKNASDPEVMKREINNFVAKAKAAWEEPSVYAAMSSSQRAKMRRIVNGEFLE